MEEQGCGIFIVLLFGVIVALVASAVRRSEAARPATRPLSLGERVAGLLHGRFISGPPHVVEFSAGGRPAKLRWAESGEDFGQTRAVVDMRGHSPGVLKIIPDMRAVGVPGRLRGQDLRIGDPDFDGRFIIKARPESLAGKVFSPERRGLVIASIRRLERHLPATIDLSRESLVVSIPEDLRTELALRQLADTASDFVAFLREVEAASAILWVETGTEKGGLCQVCGTEMEARVVRCARCGTPHHRECWRYYGQCSTYGCGARRFEEGAS